MSYESREASVSEGRPVEAYEILGIFGSYRYTDADEEVVIGGKTFYPIIIERSNVELTTITDALKYVNVISPQDAKLAKDYGTIDTPERLSLKIYRAHRGDDWSTDFQLIHSGVCYGYNYDGRYFTVSTVPFAQAFVHRPINQTVFQLQCNHALYDKRCQVKSKDNRSESTVTAFSGVTVTVAASPWPNGDLIKGRLVSMTGWESRAILANAGNVLTIDRPFLRINVGDGMRMIRGCNKTFKRCKDGFNNSKNFGGFPFKPEEFKIIKVGIGELPGPKIEVLSRKLLKPPMFPDVIVGG